MFNVKHFWVQHFFGQNIFGVKIFWGQKILGGQTFFVSKFLMVNIFGSTFFWVNIFSCKTQLLMICLLFGWVVFELWFWQLDQCSCLMTKYDHWNKYGDHNVLNRDLLSPILPNKASLLLHPSAFRISFKMSGLPVSWLLCFYVN